MPIKKILWVTNIPFGPMCEMLGEPNETSGSWLDAAYQAVKDEPGIELNIATVSRIDKRIEQKIGNTYFYILPGGYPFEYDINSSSNYAEWEYLAQHIKPKVLQIWGTEFTQGFLAQQCMSSVPTIIYMQGLLSSIAKHYNSGISTWDQINNITLRDILKWDWIDKQRQNFKKRAETEMLMLRNADYVIVENNWCELHCIAIAPNIKAFKSNLSIKDVFFQTKWNEESMQKNTILCNASGYPIKGLHMLIKALNIVVRKYPNVLLKVPGENSPFEMNFKQKLKINGYTNYIKSLIEKYNLRNNIQFLGRLSSQEMANEMSNANVFAMVSSIENHSSTLIEALNVGVPAVASNVGGVSEYLTHGVNGLLYRFEEYEILAMHIMSILDSPNLARRLSHNAISYMNNNRPANQVKSDFKHIYTHFN